MAMLVEGGGDSWTHINSYEYYERLSVNELNKVTYFTKLFTKKNTCAHCKAKLSLNNKDIVCGNPYVKYMDKVCFEFDSQCTSCGSRYFNYNDNLYYYIDKSIINNRKSKINTLLKKSKKWYNFK